jgi:hypothetical protein
VTRNEENEDETISPGKQQGEKSPRMAASRAVLLYAVKALYILALVMLFHIIGELIDV